MTPFSLEDAIRACEDVCSGRATVAYDEEPVDFFSGDLEFRLSNGWKVFVFVDCGDWDCVDHFVAPDGSVFDCTDKTLHVRAEGDPELWLWHGAFYWQPHNDMVRPGGAQCVDCAHWGKWPEGQFATRLRREGP